MSHGGPEHHEAAAPAAGAEHHGTSHDAGHAKSHDAGHGHEKAPDASHGHEEAHAEAGHGEKPHGDKKADAHGEKPHGKDAAHATAETGPSALRTEIKEEATKAWQRIKDHKPGAILGDRPPTEEVSLIKTPFYMIRDMIRGSIGNVYRRGKEIIQPAGAALESAWNAISKPMNSPVKTVFHLPTYLSNIPRIFTAGVRSIKNLYKAPLTAANEAYQDIIQTPLERINLKTQKIGPISSTIAKTSNAVANAIGWPVRKLDDFVKWATSPVDDADDYLGGIVGA
jgi:hypothetical protein